MKRPDLGPAGDLGPVRSDARQPHDNCPSSAGYCVVPEIGIEVVLGKLRARIVRHHPQGFGVQFIDIQNPIAPRRHFG